LLTYHPEAVNAQQQQNFAARIIEECALHDIPFFLEPVTYSLDPNIPLDTVELWQIVVEMAGVFSKMGVDILKLQFPVDPAQETDEAVWATACKEIDAACDIPWALLSGGVDFETFARQTRVACAAGASGVMVGRAVWAEATTLQGEKRENFLATTAQQRMLELANICAQHARPWHERVEKPVLTLNWYEGEPH
jgi:tagatose-1,6-bisphosphate aldolase